MEKTWFQIRLEQRMQDPKFAVAYRKARAEMDAAHALVRAERARVFVLFFVGVVLGAALFAVIWVATTPTPRPAILLDAGVE